MGSVRHGQDVRANRLWDLLRSNSAEVLLLLRQPQPAIYDAHLAPQPPLSKRGSELRFDCANPAAIANGDRRPPAATPHPVQCDPPTPPPPHRPPHNPLS